MVQDTLEALQTDTIPRELRARFIDDVNGLRMHVLEAGFESGKRPLVLLLHGFPELAYSWRKVMVPLAQLGFHVVAPDQRGYGRTTGWSAAYDQDLQPFSLLRLAGDAVALIHALGYPSAAAVIGHDFGSPVTAWGALARPDVFRSVVLMSAPFAGAPSQRIRRDGETPAEAPGLHASRDAVAEGLAALPRPRKHYQWYYATPEANADMLECRQGVQDFLRAYFHHKSADWAGNAPHRLADASPQQLALMPTYYIMDLAQTMADTVAPHMPSPAEIAACRWMTDAEMRVYAEEFRRTGFQGGLNWYRTRFEPDIAANHLLYANRRLEVPAMFIAGKSDWGVFQVPGAYEQMQATACADMRGCHLVEGAGHWVMQERPGEVTRLLTGFLGAAGAGTR